MLGEKPDTIRFAYSLSPLIRNLQDAVEIAMSYGTRR